MYNNHCHRVTTQLQLIIIILFYYYYYYYYNTTRTRHSVTYVCGVAC